MQYDIGIRVDMGGRVGSGHYFRCLAIFQQLQKSRIKSVFLVKNEKELLKHGNNVPYIRLEKGPERVRVRQCKTLAEKIRLFIIDLPHYSESYSRGLGVENKKIILDDVGGKKYDCDAIINGTAVKKFQRYGIKDTKTYLGPKYMILRKEFHQIRKNHRTSASVKKILVTFGGSDENDYSYKISKILCQNGYKVTVLLGPAYKGKRISELLKKFKNLRIKRDVRDVARLFVSQDLAVCSVGVTVYELACVGTPYIMIPVTKLQKIMAGEIQRQGFGSSCENLRELEGNLSGLDSLKTRRKMAKKGRDTIDGKGLLRVSKIITSIIK